MIECKCNRTSCIDELLSRIHMRIRMWQFEKKHDSFCNAMFWAAAVAVIFPACLLGSGWWAIGFNSGAVPIGAVFGDPTDFEPQKPAESGGIQRTGKLSVRQWGCWFWEDWIPLALLAALECNPESQGVPLSFIRSFCGTWCVSSGQYMDGSWCQEIGKLDLRSGWASFTCVKTEERIAWKHLAYSYQVNT